MTRIDHAARAEAPLKEEARYQFGKIDALAEALTHATLALVEQQRIANLLALASLAAREDTQEELSEAAYGALNALITYQHIANGHPEGPDEVVVPRPDIAAALGIEATS